MVDEAESLSSVNKPSIGESSESKINDNSLTPEIYPSTDQCHPVPGLDISNSGDVLQPEMGMKAEVPAEGTKVNPVDDVARGGQELSVIEEGGGSHEAVQVTPEEGSVVESEMAPTAVDPQVVALVEKGDGAEVGLEAAEIGGEESASDKFNMQADNASETVLADETIVVGTEMEEKVAVGGGEQTEIDGEETASDEFIMQSDIASETVLADETIVVGTEMEEKVAVGAGEQTDPVAVVLGEGKGTMMVDEAAVVGLDYGEEKSVVGLPGSEIIGSTVLKNESTLLGEESETSYKEIETETVVEPEFAWKHTNDDEATIMETEMSVGEKIDATNRNEAEAASEYHTLQHGGTASPILAKDERDEETSISEELLSHSTREMDLHNECHDGLLGADDETVNEVNGKGKEAAEVVITAIDTKTEKEETVMEEEGDAAAAEADTKLDIETNLEMEKEESVMEEEGDAAAEVDTKLDIETNVEMEKVDEASLFDNSSVDPLLEEDEAMVGDEDTGTADTEMETETDAPESGSAAGGKRKRGRNSKGLVAAKVAAKTPSRQAIGEDVCFICFDGGELVLCDRRGCPKAYHPSCVNRDEAFFRAKGRWNCGWHLCSICEKNAHYMCYTCTYSLCKGCIKGGGIMCVRGNKGFCETCVRIVMLIENNSEGDKDDQIDFDDRSSWEYLFKDYYIDLKAKLSLSPEELAEARNSWKGSDTAPSQQESPELQVGANDSGSDNPTENLEVQASKPKKRKIRKRLKSQDKEEELGSATARVRSEGISMPGNNEWASKELLEFVMHMRNGDRSTVSQFDVQALLLEYIKRNKLRDPRRKSQIVCDARLQNLFGKPRVGHFEMLKLLESHFFVVEDSQTDDIQGSVVDTDANQLEGDENADTLSKGVKDKKRRTRKKGDRRGPQSNLDDYAAIDMHNISLIYLRRKLMEDLLEDIESFQDKVVGTFVRIRISGSIQKQDLYRLVQVVGISQAAEPYKVGKKSTDFMLEILNLNKTEIVSIDTISNQDFTEEECLRLRQSIKCGLINRLTVGDILDKATEIQVARVNDWLESEILRLSHLRDRASETGRRKELRECVEKLQLLKTPEERRRRLEEVPQIHADPHMDPSYESEEDGSEADNSKREFDMKRGAAFRRRGRGPVSPVSDFATKDSWSTGGKASNMNWESSRNLSGKSFSSQVEVATYAGDLMHESSWKQAGEKDAPEYTSLQKLTSVNDTETAGASSYSVSRSGSSTGAASATSSMPPSAKAAETDLKINETEKIWHYKDPSGKIQGPFSIVQLRKWNNTGYFPTDLKIWRNGEKQDDCLLLTDVLAGKVQKEHKLVDSTLPVSNTPQNLSVDSAKCSDTTLQQLKEAGHKDILIVEQNHRAQDSYSNVSLQGGQMASSVDVPKLSTERWVTSESSNLPSPTPELSNKVSELKASSLSGTSSHSRDGGVLQSSAAALPEGGQLAHSTLTSFLDPGSGNLLHPSQSNVANEAHGAIRSNLSTAEGVAAQPIKPADSQKPEVEPNGSVSAPNQKVEPNASIPMIGQAQVYGHWGGGSPTVQNVHGNLSGGVASALPQTDIWRPPAQGNPPMMQPTGAPSMPWGPGMVENNPALVVRPENSNPGWGAMHANANMGWGGSAPGITNMSWGPIPQGPSPGNANPVWPMPSGNPGATVQGPIGNVNPGWSAQPNVQGMAPGNANVGWINPMGNMGPTGQGPAVQGPGNVWAPAPGGPPPGNLSQGWIAPGNPNQGPPPGNPNQGLPPGNLNQGWVAPAGNQGGPPSGSHGWVAPAGNQGPWGSDQQQSGGKFSGQREMGFQGGDSGMSGGRPWNRQSSFGSGGPGGSRPTFFKGQMVCPYNSNGRCKKGAACDYLHT